MLFLNKIRKTASVLQVKRKNTAGTKTNSICPFVVTIMMAVKAVAYFKFRDRKSGVLMKKLKKVGKIAGNILLYLFLAICVFSILLTLFSRKGNDGTAEIFGYQLRIVASNSMEKCDRTDVSAYRIKSIPLRSMVFVKVVPEDEALAEQWYRSLQVGDVLTIRYVYTSQVTITHRITAITEKESGGYIIELAGDNKNSDTETLTQRIDTSIPNNTNYVIGKVTGQAFLPGLVISVLKTTPGIVFCVIVPCAIIMLMEVLKIVGLYQQEKKKQELAEKQRRDIEIDQLRRRVAQLERGEEKLPPCQTMD